MRKIILCLCLALTNNVNAQSIPLPTALPIGLPNDINKLQAPSVSTKPNLNASDNLQFNSITLSNLLTVVFGEIETRSYVLSPKVIADQREISFRYSKSKNGNLQAFMSNFLEPLGYQIKIKSGVLYVEDIEQKKAEDFNYHVYIPKYQKADYLIENIRPYFGEYFSASVKGNDLNHKVESNNVVQGSVLDSSDKSQKVLTFKYEEEKTKKKILSLLSQLDRAEQNLIVKAYIYEVQYNKKDGSALGLVLNLASSKLNINLGGNISPAENFVKFSSNALGLLFSQIDTDSRFKLVSNPLLRVKDGKTVNFNVGSSVPILGAVTYQDGNAIQNTDYKDTGLIFKVTPTVQAESVEINLNQEISEVVNTTTGVNNSPTFAKRSLSTVFDTKKNEIVMLAGLTNNKKNNAISKPFLLSFLKNNNSSDENTEILIFFQILDAQPELELPITLVTSR